MKNVLLAVFLMICVMGCAPQSEVEDSAASDKHAAETVYIEDFEGEEEGKLEIPPEGALPLSEILVNLEVGNHTSIVEVEFEDGVWDIDYVVGGEAYEILVDPMTGEALDEETEKPDDH